MYPSSIVLGLQSNDKQYGEPLQRSWLYILALTSKIDDPRCALIVSAGCDVLITQGKSARGTMGTAAGEAGEGLSSRELKANVG